MTKSANGVDNCGALSSRSLNFSPKAQISFGPGTSWDITKLTGPAKWSYCLYLIIDIFKCRTSRTITPRC
jgi:hypothetical protein